MFARPDQKHGRMPWAGAWKRVRLLLLASSLLACTVAYGAARARDVQVRIDPKPRTFRVEGVFRAKVPPVIAWKVLTDYDRIADFVHSMVSSQSRRDSSGRLRVRQVATGGVFIFHRKVEVLLAIEEESGRRIRFRDVSGRDFRHYHGEWRIEPDSLGVQVRYELEAEPRAALPRSLYRGIMKDAVGDLLSEVRAEMLRRAADYPDPAPGRH